MAVHADIYKCTNNGSIEFSDNQCKGDTKELYYKDTVYDIQRREREKQKAKLQRAQEAQQRKTMQDAQQVIGLIEASRIEEAHSYAGQSGLDFDKLLAIYQENLREQQQQQELERQSRLIAQQQEELEDQERKARRQSRNSSFTSGPTESQWLHDPFSGTTMPRTGGGYTDPRTGTFYHDVGGGVVNTRTGQFTPTH